jgi:hypothetical protein
MIATNKRLLISKTRSDSNWCTPYRGKADQHDTYAFHSSPSMLGLCFLRVVPVHGNLSQDTDNIGQSHCSWEKELSTQSTVRWLTDPWVCTQFLSRANQWSSGESQASINSRLLGLLDPYHRHAIGTLNTCSRGSTHRSSTNTGRGYNLGGAIFPHTHSPTFPSSCLHFPLKAPPGLHFNQPPTWIFDQAVFGRHVVFWPLDHLP